MSRKAVTVIILLICLIYVLIFSNTQYSEQQVQYNFYCDMVELHKSSNGEYGWPAYKGDCK